MGWWFNILDIQTFNIIVLPWHYNVHFNAHSSQVHWVYTLTDTQVHHYTITHTIHKYSKGFLLSNIQYFPQFVPKINSQIFVLIWSMLALNFRGHQRNSLFIYILFENSLLQIIHSANNCNMCVQCIHTRGRVFVFLVL